MKPTFAAFLAFINPSLSVKHPLKVVKESNKPQQAEVLHLLDELKIGTSHPTNHCSLKAKL